MKIFNGKEPEDKKGLTGRLHYVVISSRNCAIRPVASTICCHQPVTPTSPPDSEEHPCTLDLVIEPTVTNHSFTMLF